MRTGLLLVSLFLPVFAAPSHKPSQGRVRMYVGADASGVYKGAQQRAIDLEESARDLRKSLKKSDWVELVDEEKDADVRLRILGRRVDPNKGFALGYFLDAGAYKTDDEFLYSGESIPTGGGRSRDAQDMSDDLQPRKTLGWSELAKKFGRSLEEFAESNYQRIVSQRKPRS